MKKPTLIVIAVLATTALSLAGSMWRLKCEDSKCKFEADLGIGGGFVFGKATGYCTTCREFVSVRWKAQDLTGKWKEHADKSDLPDAPPKKVGTVWNSATGLTADLYSCPKCSKPFMEVTEMDFMKARETVMDTALALMDDDRGADEDEKVHRLNILMKLAQSEKAFCPHCTNLTLRTQNRGQYD